MLLASRHNLCSTGLHTRLLSTGTYSFTESACLQHRFKNWQEQRTNKLTASTFAQASGFWPRRRVELWLEKIGATKPFTGNIATCWNNIKEEEALERYKLITGNSIMFPKFQVYKADNPEENWLAASPDGDIGGELLSWLPSRGVLEIKCPYFDGDKSKSFPWSRLPNYCIPQAQGVMEILDRDWMHLYVYTINGSSLFRLYRDVEYWNILKIALFDFWWKHVQPAKEICSKYNITDPLTDPYVQSFRPRPRHEYSSWLLRASKRVIDNSELLVREIHGKLQD